MTIIFFKADNQEDTSKIIEALNEQAQKNPLLKSYYKFEAGIMPIAKKAFFQIKCFFSIISFPKWLLKISISSRAKKLGIINNIKFFSDEEIIDNIIATLR